MLPYQQPEDLSNYLKNANLLSSLYNNILSTKMLPFPNILWK